MDSSQSFDHDRLHGSACAPHDSEACSNCSAPFTGAGRFDRISERPPSVAFADRFPHMGTTWPHQHH
jgi:hypothetical protein